MPSVDDNKKYWDGDYQWENRGDEWSAAWGGPAMQWYGMLLPRIHRFVPTGNILEIACGYGRWTQYLKDLCEKLAVVELSEECLQACQQRFAESPNIEYHLTDGKSLQMIADGSIDLVFSFDSLVHADESVFDQYFSQLPRILKDDGAVFFHHSNLGEYQSLHQRIRSIPKLWGLLFRLGVLEKNLHWRDPGVSAELVAALAEKHGLTCVSQEIIPWGTKWQKIDCLSVIVKKDSALARPNRIFRNGKFMQEAGYLSALSHLYSVDKKPQGL